MTTNEQIVNDTLIPVFKILLIGDSGVGKTSLLLRFSDREFQEEQQSTIGIDLKIKKVKIGDKKVKITVWDTAGQERFRTLTSAYYRGAHGIIMVYDVSNKRSFDHLINWIKEVDQYGTNEEAVIILVGNKIDLEHLRMVSREEGLLFARKHSTLFIEASAKTNQGVEQAFEELMQKIIEIPTLCEIKERDIPTLKIDSYNGSWCGGYC
jgi:Ras-related protein Rab-18